MGKLSYDPKHEKQSHSLNLKGMNRRSPPILKKKVKITYISSPLLVKACNASEFRSVVQQLTGKDSNNLNILKNQSPHKELCSTLRYNININNQDHSPTYKVMQGGDLRATEDGNGSSYYDNRSTNSLEFDEDYFWKEFASSVLHPPCVLV